MPALRVVGVPGGVMLEGSTQGTLAVPPREPFFNAPNLLTLSRLPLAALPWLDVGSAALLFAALALAALTDVLDGWAARRLRARRIARGEPPGRVAGPHAVGAWLDPVCDKAFVASVLAVLFVGASVPVALLVLVGLRELVQIPMALVYRAIPGLHRRMRFDFRAGLPGKLATVSQFVAVVLLRLGHPFAAWSAGVAGAVGLVAAGHYLHRAVVTAASQSPSRS